jgi:hypothetical protein
MELLKVLAMPFQMASLLFVAVTSLLLGLLHWLGASLGGSLLTTSILSLFAMYLMLVWLTNYAFHLIDDAANGVREARVASVEMMQNPFLDSRTWVHPFIALALGVMHYVRPQWPAWPTLVFGALFFPASIGACAISSHARDALNPLMMLRVVRGLGAWYTLLVALVAGCVLLGVMLAHLLSIGVVLIASLQLLVLLVYAVIGGALFERRLELGFEPRISPERAAQRVEAERQNRRQQFIDGLYKDLRVRETPRAVANARQWLGAAQPQELAVDLHAILAAGRSWMELREYPRLLQGLLTVLLELKQPGLACAVAETGLAAFPAFGPSREDHAVALARYALDTGRRRTAMRLLENYLQRLEPGRQPGPELAALRDRLLQPT